MARKPKTTTEVTEELNPPEAYPSVASQTELEILAGQQALRRRQEALINELSVAATVEVDVPVTLPKREALQLDIEDFVSKSN